MYRYAMLLLDTGPKKKVCKEDGEKDKEREDERQKEREREREREREI